jgi:hypothetical protein
MKDNDSRLFTVLMVMGLAGLSLVIDDHSPNLSSARVTVSSHQQPLPVHGDGQGEAKPLGQRLAGVAAGEAVGRSVAVGTN